VVLLIIAFTLFRPGYWLDQVSPPFDDRPGAEVIELAGNRPVDDMLRIKITGPDINNPDRIFSTSILVPMDDKQDGMARLENNGLFVTVDDDAAAMEEPLPGSPFVSLGRKFDFYGDDQVVIETVSIPNERVAKEIFYIPAVLLLALVVTLQFRRKRSDQAGSGAAATA
jgi:hypothetical protein